MEDIIICQCHSTEHQYIFLYDESDINDKNVYIHVHLNKKNFFNRLKYGFKYIFGYRCRFGAFDEFIINPKDINKFEKIVEYLKK